MKLDFINYLKTLKTEVPKVIEQTPKKTMIHIEELNNVVIVEIDNYLTAAEYVEELESLNSHVINEHLSMSVIWNSALQKVTKGTIFIFYEGRKLYNILIGDDLIKIDERILLADSTKEERVLQVIPSTREYHFSFLKHDEIGSTFFTKYYGKDHTVMLTLALNHEEAYQEIISIIESLRYVDGITNILDMDAINDCLRGYPQENGYTIVDLEEASIDKILVNFQLWRID